MAAAVAARTIDPVEVHPTDTIRSRDTERDQQNIKNVKQVAQNYLGALYHLKTRELLREETVAPENIDLTESFTKHTWVVHQEESEAIDHSNQSFGLNLGASIPHISISAEIEGSYQKQDEQKKETNTIYCIAAGFRVDRCRKALSQIVTTPHRWSPYLGVVQSATVLSGYRIVLECSMLTDTKQHIVAKGATAAAKLALTDLVDASIEYKGEKRGLSHSTVDRIHFKEITTYGGYNTPPVPATLSFEEIQRYLILVKQDFDDRYPGFLQRDCLVEIGDLTPLPPSSFQEATDFAPNRLGTSRKISDDLFKELAQQILEDSANRLYMQSLPNREAAPLSEILSAIWQFFPSFIEDLPPDSQRATRLVFFTEKQQNARTHIREGSIYSPILLDDLPFAEKMCQEVATLIAVKRYSPSKVILQLTQLGDRTTIRYLKKFLNEPSVTHLLRETVFEVDGKPISLEELQTQLNRFQTKRSNILAALLGQVSFLQLTRDAYYPHCAFPFKTVIQLTNNHFENIQNKIRETKELISKDKELLIMVDRFLVLGDRLVEFENELINLTEEEKKTLSADFFSIRDELLGDVQHAEQQIEANNLTIQGKIDSIQKLQRDTTPLFLQTLQSTDPIRMRSVKRIPPCGKEYLFEYKGSIPLAQCILRGGPGTFDRTDLEFQTTKKATYTPKWWGHQTDLQAHIEVSVARKNHPDTLKEIAKLTDENRALEAKNKQYQDLLEISEIGKKNLTAKELGCLRAKKRAIQMNVNESQAALTQYEFNWTTYQQLAPLISFLTEETKGFTDRCTARESDSCTIL